MQRLLTALAGGLLLVAAVGLIALLLLAPDKTPGTDPVPSGIDDPPIPPGEELRTNGSRLVKFYYDKGPAVDPDWLLPPTGIVERTSLPAPARSLNLAATLHQGAPLDDCLELLDVFLIFQRAYGENPVGDQVAILKALCGANPKRIEFLSAQHPNLTDDWQLLDRWGNPFFFHQLSGTEIEVISRGPDGELYSEDDFKAP